MLQVASHDDNAALAAKLTQARLRLLEVYAGLPEEFWQCERFPYLVVVNPPLWEWAHVAWFQEYWCHRHDFSQDRPICPPMLKEADDWVDSRKVPHKVRWQPGHPTKQTVLDYMQRTLDRTLGSLERAEPEGLYPFRLALYHETMHVEALLMTLRTLGLPMPAKMAPMAAKPDLAASSSLSCSSSRGNAPIAAGLHRIGSEQNAPHFVFDNERNAHTLALQGFSIARHPVSRGEFLAFVRQSYANEAVWSPAGWAWKQALPQRQTDWLDSLEENADEPVEGVSAYEAESFCTAAGRRLPTEFEWEVAAGGDLLLDKGHVWEWTASDFLPYAGFSADPYREYSQPWFGDHRVLKGGSWATHSDLKRPAFRNFYLPGRTDVFAGFRTCAL